METRNANFAHFLTSLSPDDSSLWKANKFSNDTRCRFLLSGIPMAAGPRVTRRLRHLRLTSARCSRPTHLPVPTTLWSLTPLMCLAPRLHITPFSPAELSAMIASLNVRKASGYELISGKVLQELPHKAFNLLTNLYSSMLRLSYYPIIWKFAKI